MNRKVLVIAVAVIAVAMLALPMSVVSATKPEKFVNVTFYGHPGAVYHYTFYPAGDSANRFMIWWDTDWVFSWNKLGTQTMAEGEYEGRWIFHGWTGPSTFTSANVHGTWDMEVTSWEGETGNLVIKGVDSKLTIISGTIGGKPVHGEGTSTALIQMALYKYDFTIHFGP